jgi:hypothetical protein
VGELPHGQVEEELAALGVAPETIVGVQGGGLSEARWTWRWKPLT